MDKAYLILALMTAIAFIVAIGVGGSLAMTWLKIRHGYPLTDGWGRAVHPVSSDETIERVRLLTQENSQLRAEIGALKDRLANVERIVTDRSHSLDHEIENLRLKAN